MEKLFSVRIGDAVLHPDELNDYRQLIEVQRLPLKNAIQFASRLFESSFVNCYVVDPEKDNSVIAYMIHFDKFGDIF